LSRTSAKARVSGSKDNTDSSPFRGKNREIELRRNKLNKWDIGEGKRKEVQTRTMLVPRKV
jgi:hypothetical protein